MGIKRRYCLAISFCGDAEMFVNSALGLIIIVLSLIYWEVIND